jgi:DNA-binding CsgD family transcriptional regulator
VKRDFERFSIYFYQTHHAADRKLIVELYTSFGVITEELAEMLKIMMDGNIFSTLKWYQAEM